MEKASKPPQEGPTTPQELKYSELGHDKLISAEAAKIESPVTPTDEVPDGGLRAWLVVFGGFFML